MTRRLRWAGGIGLGVLGVLLHVAFPTHEFAVQLTVWTMIVAAVVIGENYQHYGESWFWKACAAILAVHAVIVATFLHSLPFPSLGIAILMSFPEAVLCLLVFRLMANNS